jgi:fatty acid desaturase
MPLTPVKMTCQSRLHDPFCVSPGAPRASDPRMDDVTHKEMRTMATQAQAPSEALLRDYMRAPLLAVPTALLAVTMLGGMALVWYLCLSGRMSFWAGALVNGLLSYGLFSPIHDGAHRAISRIGWLNETIADVSLLFLFPYAPMVALRWLHNQHHIHANGVEDPDRFEHDAPRWQAPLRWAFFDLWYIWYFFTRGQHLVKKHKKELIVFYSCLALVVGFLIYQGLGYELFMLWFIPVRIALFMIAVVFVILPHHPAVVSQQEDPYLATTMRMGWEWRLTPLLV